MGIIKATDFGCQELAEGKLRKVWLCEKEIKALSKSDATMRRRAAKIMEKYCDCELSALGPTQYKLAQRDKKGGQTIALKEFKANQLRMYGIEETINGDRVFIVVKVDGQKKQTKANPANIATALRKAWEYTELIRRHHG